MRVEWKKPQYLLARISKEQRQEKILSVRFIFPLSKQVPCTVICKSQSISHQKVLHSSSSTLKVLSSYIHAMIYLPYLFYVFHLTNQVDIENCWRFSSLSSAVHRKKGLKLKSFQSVKWNFSEGNNCWSDWWNFTCLVDRKPWQTCRQHKLHRLYAS